MRRLDVLRKGCCPLATIGGRQVFGHYRELLACGVYAIFSGVDDWHYHRCRSRAEELVRLTSDVLGETLGRITGAAPKSVAQTS